MSDMNIPADVQNDGQALAIVMEADDLSEAMSYLAVNSSTELDFAAGELRSIVTKKDQIEATFQRLKKPFSEGIAQLRAFFDIPIKRLAEAEAAVKQQIGAFQLREQTMIVEAKRESAEQRDDRIADLKGQVAELEVEAITADTPEEAEEKAQAAAELRAAINDMQSLPEPANIPTASRADGVSTRSNWQGEVSDPDLLWAAAIDDPTLRSLFKVDPAALRNLAKLTKNSRQIPGLRIFNKGSVAVRRNAPGGGT